MKIFISYGHNDYEELVNAVYDDLRKNGHEVWKDNRYEDNSGIPAGADFTEVIYDTLKRYDYVIAFVTAKTKNKIYCCDERNYAYTEKGRRFIQIRLDNVEITLGNSGNYVDMNNVTDSRGNINQELFRKKMEVIYAALNNPYSLLSPSAKIEKYLKIDGIQPYEEFVSMPDKYDFVGREWLKEKCVGWVLDDSIACRVFVILGNAGTGKTAFVKNLAKDDKLVRSVHICVYDKPSTRKIKDVLKDLSYVLSLKNENYKNYLNNCDFEEIMQYDYDGLFNVLFIEPLKNEKEKYLLIIDGLDELERKEGFEPLISIFRQYANRINSHISILVTGRPDDNIVNELRTVIGDSENSRVLLDEKNGKEDFLKFTEKNLTELGCYSAALLEKITEACDGNFEYLSLLFKEAKETGDKFSEEIPLPKGLANKYAEYLDRRLKDRDKRFSKEQMYIFSVLAAAYEPLPVSLVSEITGIDEYDADTEIEMLGSLIRKETLPDGDYLLSFFSKGFCDFLASGEFRNYMTRTALGKRLIADYILKKCRSEEALGKFHYFDKYGFVHIFMCSDIDTAEITEYVKSFICKNEDKAVMRIKNALVFSSQTIENFYFVGKELSLFRAVEKALRENREISALKKLAEVYKKQGEDLRYMLLNGDILRLDASPAALSDAEKLYYRKYLEICLEKYHDEPTYENRKNLSEAYDRLGDILRLNDVGKKLADAKECYLKKLQLDILSYEEKPCYESRYALGISYDRLGYISKKRETDEELEAPEYYYEKKLEIIKEAYREKSCYDCRFELSRAYDRLAGVLKAKSTQEAYAQAERLYLEQLPYAEQNYQENPCYERRIELAVLYKNLAYIAHVQRTGTVEKENEMAYAEQFYRKSFELIKKNYEENPCYRSRRELALIYERLGYVEHAKGPEFFRSAERYYRQSVELIENNNTGISDIFSKRDLFYAYKMILDFYYSSGSDAVKEEIKYWETRMTLADSFGL